MKHSCLIQTDVEISRKLLYKKVGPNFIMERKRVTLTIADFTISLYIVLINYLFIVILNSSVLYELFLLIYYDRYIQNESSLRKRANLVIF